MLRAGAVAAGVLPGSLTALAVLAAGVTTARAPGRRAQRALVRRHLRRVLGARVSARELERRVDEAYVFHARYWAESLRLMHLSPERISAGVREEQTERIHRARDAGNGVILALPHLGGWEWGGAWLVDCGLPVSVVVERIDPPELFEWFVGYRRRLGMEVIPVGPQAAAASLRALRDNRVLCLLCDRVVGDIPGTAVPFFGERTELPSGPAALARRSGAPLLPTAVYLGREADDHLAVIRPAIDVPRTRSVRSDVAAATAALAGELEVLIRRAPTQWHLLQPNWPSDPR